MIEYEIDEVENVIYLVGEDESTSLKLIMKKGEIYKIFIKILKKTMI